MPERSHPVAISVAICTWNRARLLEQTLAQICRLNVPPGLEWELIVVDNHCTDDTPAVIDRYRKLLPIRSYVEPKLGLSHARNRAVALARGQTLLWTDDDVLVDPAWLANYASAFQQWPEAVFFGGPIQPWFAKSPPRWATRHLASVGYVWALLDKGNEVRPLDASIFPFGANMAFRMEVLRKHPFDVHQGPVGSKLLRGEEIELVMALRREGQTGVWVGNAPVRHYLPAERVTTGYLWQFNYNAGAARLLTPEADCGKRFLGVPRWMLRRYWEARLTSWCCAPFKGKRWLQAFTEAARCKGAIDSYRAKGASEPPAKCETPSSKEHSPDFDVV